MDRIGAASAKIKLATANSNVSAMRPPLEANACCAIYNTQRLVFACKGDSYIYQGMYERGREITPIQHTQG